ncbi:hypothetical protein [Methanoregula sp.]|uniref:hypothetical protein n=1 Tax=Methanoregula sp. TaxID=2052170 RepID=UPI003561AF34
MQLPRGTFREIKKHEKIRLILEALGHERFCGICTLSYPAGKGTLVFRHGDCILAKVMALYGDAGLLDLLPFLDETGDAAITLLDEAQLRLALEFNKKALVKKPGILAVARIAKSHHLSVSLADANPPAGTGSPSGTETVILRSHTPKKMVSAQPHTPHNASRSAPRNTLQDEHDIADGGLDGTGSGSTSFDQDMETLDSLDLENVTNKIRGDCRTLVKQLDLEHLLER